MKKTTMTSLYLPLATVLLTLSLMVGCADDSPEKHLADAKQSLQKNDRKTAVIQIKNALQQDPGLGEARAMLGSALLADGNAVAAEVELRKALAAGFPPESVAPDLASALLAQGQWKKVVDEFAQTQVTGGDAARMQLVLASAYAQLNQPQQAQKALAAALVADPNHAPALLADARQKAGAGEFDTAHALAERVLKNQPDNADAWKFEGDLLLYGSNKPQEALQAYRKALDVNLTHMPSHAAILTLLLQQGDLDAAARQLEALKKFGAQNPQTRYFEAQLAFFRGDYKLAREISQQLLQQLPNNPRVLQVAGAVEFRTGQLAQAAAHLSRATQLAPELRGARRLLIRTYLQAGQADKALAVLTATTSKDGLEPEMYSLAGEVYLHNGDAKKSEEYFAKALTLDPANARNRTALAISRLARGQTAAGFDELENIAASDKKATADLALISLHLRRNELDKALAAIDRLESKQPQSPVAANLRGRVLIAKKDRAGARKSFERALSIDPSFFAAVASLAAMDVGDKKPEEAKKRFEKLLVKDPKNAQALLALAQLAMVGRADKGEVTALLARAIDANATEAAPRLFLIEYHFRNGDAKQALSAAQSAVAAVPNSAELLAALGRAQQLSGDFNQAVATYNKLVALQPQSPQAHIRLAEAHAAGKNFQAAEQGLRKALEIKPDAIDAQRGLILLHLENKKYPQAIAIARTVRTQRPKEASGWVMEGDVNAASKSWAAAAVAYRSALQLAPDATGLAMKLHAATVESGKATDADKFAAAWLKAHPKDAGFHSYLGVGAIAQKDYGVAQKHYEAALKIEPDNAVALNNLAWIVHQAQGPGALDYAEKANRLAPGQPQFMDTLATLLSAKGEHARAVELQTKALELQPSNAAFRLNLAKILIAAGERARARTELEALAKLGDNNVAQREVNALLKTL